MIPRVRDWVPGNNVFENEHHQEMVRALRELDRQQGVKPREWRPREEWPGTIVNAGPNGEADTSTAQYWVQRGYLLGNSSPTSSLSVKPDLIDQNVSSGGGGTPTAPVVRAFHFNEIQANTHTLSTDGTQYVWVWAWFDAQNPNVKQYLFLVGGGGAKLLWGTLTADWNPGDNAVSLQPCVSSTNSTSLKKSDGVTPVDPVGSVLIQLPTSAITPCFQPLMSDNKPLGYKTEGGISYLINPQLWPLPQNQYETIVNMSSTLPGRPHWVNSYPLIHG